LKLILTPRVIGEFDDRLPEVNKKYQNKVTKMKCPICKDVNLVMTDRQGIEIDYCPECRGVWLDRGELDKIIEKSNSQSGFQKPREQDSKQYAHSSQNDKSHKKEKKRSSFLSELLDF
jgi:Zn-finger nucleic acid-binding protein